MFWKKKKEWRCAVCTAEYFTNPTGNIACQNCGTKIPPLRVAHDVTVKANWQDLRVLAIYAKRWSHIIPADTKANRQALEALNVVLKSLEKYQPKGAEELNIKNEVVRIDFGPLKGEKKQLAPLPELAGGPWQKDTLGRILSPFYKKL